MMLASAVIRRAAPEDAVACAAIKNDWIDTSGWMPRVHSRAEVESHYREFVFANRDIVVAGNPVEGFLSFDIEFGEVTALFVAQPGNGLGKALLDHAKVGCSTLELWTFAANDGACRFYEREGFREVRRTPGDNEEGLADVLYRWERSPIRRATSADAATCARIISDWIERTDWMPRIYSEAEITVLIVAALPDREIYLAGDPADSYLSLEPKEAIIGALFTDRPGRGTGKALMDRVKEGRGYLQLWTHERNLAAQRFYQREGFEVVERNPEGRDGLPELRMEWRR